jgi:hypothetical protein
MGTLEVWDDCGGWLSLIPEPGPESSYDVPDDPGLPERKHRGLSGFRTDLPTPPPAQKGKPIMCGQCGADISEGRDRWHSCPSPKGGAQ